MTKVTGNNVAGHAGGAQGFGTTATPTEGFWYSLPQNSTWQALALAAYGDGSAWNEIAGNPRNAGRQPVKDAEVYIPRRGAADRLAFDPQGDARRILDDGTPRGGGQAPTGDPDLAVDLNAARTAANVGNPNAVPRMNPGAIDPNDGRATWNHEEEHGRGGGDVMATIARKTIAEGRADLAKAEGETQFNLGDTEVQMRGNVHAGTVKGRAKAAFGLRLGRHDKKGSSSYHEVRGGDSEYKGPQLMAEVSARGAAHLVGAEGEIKTGVYGNSVLQGKTTLRGEAFVGAEIGGKASLGISPKGVHAAVGVDAFAGAKIRGQIKQDIGIGGEHVGRVGVRAEGWAGIGVSAKGYVNIGKDDDGRYKVKFGGKAGAALGVGGLIKLDVEIDVTGVVNLAKKTGKAVADGAKAVGNAVADGAKAVGSAISDGASAVKSFAKKLWPW